MLKKATPIVVSVALSLGAANAMAGQNITPQKNVAKPAVKAQKLNPSNPQAPAAEVAPNPQANKAAKKIQLNKERVIIQRKGPGHVA